MRDSFGEYKVYTFSNDNFCTMVNRYLDSEAEIKELARNYTNRAKQIKKYAMPVKNYTAYFQESVDRKIQDLMDEGYSREDAVMILESERR